LVSQAVSDWLVLKKATIRILKVMRQWILAQVVQEGRQQARHQVSI
jgi:hypothetical protein